jgi:hypothetical protein
MRPDPNCDRCGEVETMEHLLCECQHYSLLLWERLGEVLTRLFTTLSQDYVPRVELSQLNVIYNVPHPSVLLYVHDKLTRNMILVLIQEIKRDIIYRRMNRQQGKLSSNRDLRHTWTQRSGDLAHTSNT